MDRFTVLADVRSVNNRFLEVAIRLPRTLTLREIDVKELVRSKFSRGKVNVVMTTTRENENDMPLKINPAAAKAYGKLLNSLRKAAKIQERVTLDHLLKFPEVLEIGILEDGDEKEWSVARQALLALMGLRADAIGAREHVEVEPVALRCDRLRQLGRQNRHRTCHNSPASAKLTYRSPPPPPITT